MGVRRADVGRCARSLDRLLAERACERLLVEFVSRLDLGRPAEVAALFTEDGVWEWPAGERRCRAGTTWLVLRLAAAGRGPAPRAAGG